MPREFSVVVSINAAGARVGASKFKAGATTVGRSATRMGRQVATSNKRVTALITTIGRFRGVATLAFAGFLGVGGLGAIVKTIAQFEQGMKRVEALLGDRAVGGAIKALTERARELGATTAFTATQAAEGMQFLTLAGFDALETFQAIGPALQLAQAGMLSLGEAADIVSNIMQGFNIEASETQQVVDVLAFVSTRSNTNIRQLGQAMKFVAPVAGALGLSVEETAAALGLLGNSGLQASLAGTSLRRVLSGLLNPSKEATKVFSNLGLESEVLVAALQDPAKGLTFVINELAKSGIGAAQAFTLFGQRGAPGLLSLIGQTDDLIKFTEQLKNVEGVARTIGQVMIDNIAGDARIAISVLSEAIIRLGEAGLREWLRDVIQSFAAFIRAVSDQDQSLEGVTERVKRWASAGTLLRENIGLIRKSLVILVAFMNRVFLASMAKVIFSMGLWVVNSIKVVAGIRNMFLAVAVLNLSLKSLRTALITTGVGAFAVALGFLVDWVFFSDSASGTTDTLSVAMDRLKSKVEDQAFKWKILSEEKRGFAILDLQLLLDHETDALIRQERQMENLVSANQKIIKAQNDQAESLAILIKFGLDSESSMRQAVTTNTSARMALEDHKEATERLAQAQLLLSTTGGVTTESIVTLTDSIARLELRLAGYKAIQAGVVETMEEYLRMINNITLANELLAEGLQKDLGLTATQTIQLAELITQYNKNQDKLSDLRKEQELVNSVMGRAIDVAKGLGREQEALIITQEGLAFAIRKLENSLSPADKALEAVRDKIAKLKAGTDKVQMAIVLHEIAQRNLTREMIIAKAAPEELAEALSALEDSHTKNIEALKAACKETEEFEKCMSDSAKAMEAIWDQAMRNIQDAFADAFLGAFNSFEEFADKMLEAIKRMIAEMLSAKLLGGLKNFLGNLFSGGGGGGFLSGVFSGAGRSVGTGAAGGAAGGALGGVLAGVTGAFAGVLGAAAGFINGFTSLLGFGTPLGGSLGIGAAGGTAAGVGAFAAGGVLGFASGSITDKILGERGKNNEAFSAIGGAIGSIFGPIGALIGGAIGSFVSNLIGGAKRLEKATLNFSASSEGFAAEIETIISKQRSFFRGKKLTFTTTSANVESLDEALAAVVGSITQIADALGVDAAAALEGFSFNKTIDITGKSAAQVEALIESLFNEAIIGVITQFINNAEGLSDRLRLTVNSFTGDVEEFIRAFELASSIDLAFAIDPLQFVTDAIAKSNMTLGESYNVLIEAYRELIAEFDGSLGALEELAIATVIVVDAQVALIAALKSVGQEVSALFQDSAQFIRESLLNEEELFALRRSQIDELVEQASMTTDPEILSRLAAEINRLGLDAFGLLDAEQQAILGPEFIEFFEGLDNLFGGQIQTGIENVSADNQALNEEVATSMTAAAQAQIDAANSARQTFDDWRDFLREFRNEHGFGPGRRAELAR